MVVHLAFLGEHCFHHPEASYFLYHIVDYTPNCAGLLAVFR